MTTHTKSRTNVSIESALLEEARSRGIKLSPLLEEAIREKVRQEQADQWREENRKAIQAYNREVREHGSFSDGLRSF
ncbi:MAG: type II toxin-antitoxin system CcdA family antitoxin [Spirochaeta sp.]|jgi:antitoxin CcdA|nr:type II toxin-antitoxin system CcdA family antitoxin [Spirochaeta sp.]